MQPVSPHHDSNLVGKFYQEYYDDLMRYLTAYTHNTMDAEDMIQELFMKVMRLDVFTEETAKSLLFVMAHNMSIDDVRHKYYVRQAEIHMRNGMELSSPADVYDKMERDQIRELEERKLNTMPQKRASVYRMWRNEMSMKEIAQVLNISRRTAEAHVYNATSEMKEFFRRAM